nr:MAG TPA: SOX transcription factor [Bacteriophage sp.]
MGAFFVSSDPAIPAQKKAPTVAFFALYANHYRPRRKTGRARAILSAFYNHRQPIVLTTIKSA